MVSTALDTTGVSSNIYQYTRGPLTAPVILVGEAWGASEAAARRPFVGAAGKELDKMLLEAGLLHSDILFTNLIHFQPPNNDFTHFLYSNKDAKAHRLESFNGCNPTPPLRDGLKELEELILRVQPRLVIAAGNWPLWALGDNHTNAGTKVGYKLPSGIMNWRGSQTYTRPLGKGLLKFPLLPIIHPAAILRSWELRPVTVHDLRRAAKYVRQQEPEWSPPNGTTTHYRPTFMQMKSWLTFAIADAKRAEIWLAVDIETYRRRWISCVGLARATSELCIPFFYFDKEKAIDYLSMAEEQEIWELLRQLLEHPNVKIIGQNFIYDTQFFHRFYQIRAEAAFDTMVAHHVLMPGTPKDLATLASLYLDHYCFWKGESEDWNTSEYGAEELWKYNCKDVRATYDIAMTLHKALYKEKLYDLFTFQMEQWKLARRMMLKGTRFNISERDRLRNELMEASTAIEHWLMKAVPEQFQYTSTGTPWFRSPKGLADLLYRVIGLPPVLHKKTKQPTTDSTALEQLREKHTWLKPVFDRIELLRSLSVFNSHFLEAGISPAGRIHCSFNIAGTDTFRWSSSANGFGEGTNLQNIPKGNE